jgi:uncharacterized membrane protein
MMRPSRYIRQLRKDIEIWIESGLVSPSDRDAILALSGKTSGARSLVPILMLLGTILVGFGFLSFIAANWAAMPKILRLSLLLGALWSAFGLAVITQKRTPFAYEGFILLGSFLFGVNIMFIAQTYNISAHYPNGVMLWAIGSALAAFLAPSRAALCLSFVLASLWTGLETISFDTWLHLPFLILWGALTAMTIVTDWRPGKHMAALSFLIWLFLRVEDLANTLEFDLADIILVYGFAAALATMASLVLIRPREEKPLVFVYGYILTLGLLFAILMLDDEISSQALPWIALVVAAGLVGLGLVGVRTKKLRTIDGIAVSLLAVALALLSLFQGNPSAEVFWLKNVGYLALLVWALSFGSFQRSNLIINYALVAVAGQILYVYFSTFGGLLSDSVFFGLSGLIFILSAFGLDRLRRNLVHDQEGDAT